MTVLFQLKLSEGRLILDLGNKTNEKRTQSNLGISLTESLLHVCLTR